ncbi:MAG: hypothetical protein LBR49_08690, partial [Tannerella sp.]|nr:hypothetical protein [Tannerella sp.]
MKRIFLMAMIAAVSFSGIHAQKAKKISRYETYVYTSDRVNVLIKNEYEKEKNKNAGDRGLLSDLGMAALNASKGIA